MQAVTRGTVQGVVVAGVAVLAVGMVVAFTEVRFDWRWSAAFTLPVALGAAAGLVTRLGVGTDADDLGVHRVPAMPPRWPPPLAPWARIADIRAERHGARTVIAVYLDTGVVSRLPAPYDGRFLAHDPQFEWKLFTLRNLWATHRSGGPR